MILITTSRHPSARTRSLCNDLAIMIPNSTRINRGKMNNEELLALASAKGARTIVAIDSHMGNPSGITFTSIQREHHIGASLKFRIAGVRLQRELMSENRIYRNKKLIVLKSKGGAGLEQFIKMLAGFLKGDLIEATGDRKLECELGKTYVALKAEEASGEIILKFVDSNSLAEYGPRITLKREDVLPDSVGGSSID